MERISQKIFGLLVLVSAAAAPLSASATAKSRAVVQIAGRDQKAPAVKVQEAVENQLLGNGAHLEVQWVDRLDHLDSGHGSIPARAAEDADAMLVFWCDFTADNESVLFLTEYDDGQVLARKMTVDQVGDEGQYEAIAVMVSSAVEALELRSEMAPVAPRTNTAAATQTVTQTVSPVSTSPVYGLVGLGYWLRGFSSQQSLSHSGGVSVGMRFLHSWAVAAGYSYGHVGMDEETAFLSSNNHDFRLSGAYEWSYKRFSLAGQVGGVLGVAHWKSRFDFYRISLETRETDVNFGLEAVVRLGWRITPWLRLDTGPGITYWAVNHDYYRNVPTWYDEDLENNDTSPLDGGRPKPDKHHPDWDEDGQWDHPDATKRQTLLRPWALQPFWMVELSVSIN